VKSDGSPAGRRTYALVLGLLAGLFFLRVLGQALVALLAVSFLPPMADWYSGLLPYPILLPTQIAILGLQGAAVVDFARGRGVFVEPRPRLGRVVRRASLLYFAAMALRYVITMAVHPERRWLGTGTIPIVFHWVLAAWLFTFGHFHARREAAGPR
jgi:hypothetical protein